MVFAPHHRVIELSFIKGLLAWSRLRRKSVKRQVPALGAKPGDSITERPEVAPDLQGEPVRWYRFGL